MTVRARVILMLCLAGLAGGVPAAQDVASVTPNVAGALTAVRLSVTTPLGEGVLLLEGFRGTEAISSLFSFQLDLIAPDGRDIPFETVLGKEFRVAIALADGTTRHFSGICSRFVRSDRGTVARYQAEIAPRAWLLTRRQDSRIFQERSVPQILAQVLGGIPGHAFELRLQGTFQPRDFVVQYGETDFAFVSRLMEEEGIFYYFRHGADGHTLVVANTPQDHPDLPGDFPYRRDTTTPARPGSIFTWEKEQEIRSGKVTLWDHNFELPGQTLEGSATIQESVLAGQVVHRLAVAGNDQFETYDYPGGYAERFDGVDPSGGERPAELAKIFEDARRTAGLRMQEEAARSLSIRGLSTAPVLAPGHRFTLSLHDQAAGPYVLTSVRHAARAAAGGQGVYTNTFTCIPSGLPYRPSRTTPKPVIPGTQTAVVVGPPGQEIFTDKYGRVKVQFHWDRQGQRDDRSSCWVRVASLHAGAESGFLVVPRIGWEVVVAFQDGDPDQPIIVGSVYNPEHLPPPIPR